MSKNPAPLPLQIELLAAAENHPEIETLGRMLAKGFSVAEVRRLYHRQCIRSAPMMV